MHLCRPGITQRANIAATSAAADRVDHNEHVGKPGLSLAASGENGMWVQSRVNW